MNDINSLPPVPQHTIDAMQREAEKKFGKVPGLDEPIAQAQIHHTLQTYEEPQYQETIELESTNSPEIMESPSEFPAPEEPKIDTKEINFIALREKAKQAERERDEALKRLKEYDSVRPQQAQAPEEPDTFGMNPDDLVEGKHLSKVSKKIQDLENKLRMAEQQSYMTNTEARLKAQFPDFEKVLTSENIETFKFAFPELAATVDSTNDVYTKAVSAYKMIKQFGVYQEPGISNEKEMAKKNLSKPRPLTSVAPQQGDSPISRANAFANGLTKEVQEQMLKEMNMARKNY